VLGRDPEAAAVDEADLRAPRTLSMLAGVAASAALLAAIAYQLRDATPAAAELMTRLPWTAITVFAVLYLVQPLADLVIYRRLWGLPLSSLWALMRKTSINEAVLGYAGEAYLYFWARRRAVLANPPLATIKDVNILSAIIGFAFTLIALLIAATGAHGAELAQWLRPAFWPVAGAVGIALAVLMFGSRIFSLSRRELVFLAGVHAVRLLVACGLTLTLWEIAIPEGRIDIWIPLLAITMVSARIPFLTSPNLVAGNVVLLLLGSNSPFALLLAALAVATLCAHLVVIAAFGVGLVCSALASWSAQAEASLK
jgi:hypothetical protein